MNITFSADEDLIEKARSVARVQGKTLNAIFRDWLVQLTAPEGDVGGYDALMRSLRHIDPGRRFTREEMNE